MTTLTLPARTFSPLTRRFELLLTAQTPLSHHDAAVQDRSNRQLFNRQAVMNFGVVATGEPLSQERADAVCAAHPVPAMLAPLMQDLTFPEYLATLLVRLFADEFNSYDGTGLFSGGERWQNLESRVAHAAYTDTLHRFWARLLGMMQVGLPEGALDRQVLPLLAVPERTGADVLHYLRTQGNHVVQLARFWNDTVKRGSPEYCEKAKIEPLPAEDVVPVALQLARLGGESTRNTRLEVPHFTANAARHQMLREPLMHHLFRTLGVEPESLSPGVEAIFYNGGNIKKDAKGPSNSALAARLMRELYPGFDLLGGTTDTFDLGESMVTVTTQLLSRETAHLLPDWARELDSARGSAFDLIEDFTHTRQKGRTGEGQMIFGHEGLATGTQLLVTFDLKPWTSELAAGAFHTALAEWERRPVLGGQTARGAGKMLVAARRGFDPATDAAAREAYQTHLETHRETLLDGMNTGRLGAGAVVVS